MQSIPRETNLINHLELAIKTYLAERIDLRETEKTTITNLFNVQSTMQLESVIHTRINNMDTQVHGWFCGVIRI